jgi:hypothetical protein
MNIPTVLVMVALTEAITDMDRDRILPGDPRVVGAAKIHNTSEMWERRGETVCNKKQILLPQTGGAEWVALVTVEHGEPVAQWACSAPNRAVLDYWPGLLTVVDD